jgi:hypothetical protein
MSNQSSLHANDIPGPAAGTFGTDRKGRDLVAIAPYAVPIFWVSLFDDSHLVFHEFKDDVGNTHQVPSLVARLTVAKRLLKKRRSCLMESFPEFATTWEEFAEAVGRRKARYVKIDLPELSDLDIVAEHIKDVFSELRKLRPAPEPRIETELRGALRWYESQDDADFARLLSLASVPRYDKKRRTLKVVGKGAPRAFYLRGYACGDSGWDDEADV